jgi:hypothetical protein
MKMSRVKVKQAPAVDSIPHMIGFPWPLDKAMYDPFTYLVILRNGMVIEFECVLENIDALVAEPDWVTLRGARIIHPANLGNDLDEESQFCFERGLCIRVADIVAVVDAPHGS